MRRLWLVLIFLAAIPVFSQTQHTFVPSAGVNGTQSFGVMLFELPYSSLPAEFDGNIIYCQDCQAVTPCIGGGTGAFALAQNGTYSCSDSVSLASPPAIGNVAPAPSIATVLLSATGNATIGGNASIIGTLTSGALSAPSGAFLGPLTGCLVNGTPVLNPGCYAGVDLFAQANTAYSRLPATGGMIVLPPSASCPNVATTLTFASVGKPAALVGSGPSGSCVTYTPISGNAVLLDWGSSNSVGGGLRDLVINGPCVTNACSGITAVGVMLGSANGAQGFLLKNVRIGNGIGFVSTSFKYNIEMNNEFAFLGNFEQVSSLGGNANFYQPSSINNENLTWNGGAIAQGAHGALIQGFGDIKFNNVSFDDQTTDGINCSGNNNIFINGSHFENAGYGTSPFSTDNYIVTSGNCSVSMTNSLMQEDQTTGTTTNLITAGGNAFTSFGNTYASLGRTVTEIVLPTGGSGVSFFGDIAPPSFTNVVAPSWITGGGRAFVCELPATACLINGYQTTLSQLNISNLLISNTAPTILGTGCGGTGASIATNNGTAAFSVNVGATPATGCSIGLPTAANGWNCSATDVTTNSTTVFLQKQVGSANNFVNIINYSDVAVASNFVASDILQVSCMAR